jgi:gliding motility-associated-like protein
MNTGVGLFGTPDYYHPCGSGNTAPPNTFEGTCTPHTGNAMMGFINYNVPYPNYREYLSTKLSCAMQPGNTYTLSFWLTNGTGVISPWTIKNIGAHFSSGPLSQSGWSVINVVPQCEISSQISTTVWTQYTFTIYPTGVWNYLTLGAFRPDEQNNPTMSFPNLGGNPSVYCNYFVDDVTLISSSFAGGVSITSASNSFTVCNGQSATLSVSGASSFTWSNGSGNPSIVVSPSISSIYSVYAQPGPCSSGSATVKLNVLPELNLSSATHTVCQGKSITLTGNGNGIYVITSNGGSVLPTLSPSVSGIYTLMLSNLGTGYNCNKTVTTQILVHPNPFADFNYSFNSCGGGVNFINQSDASAIQYFWQLNSTKTSSFQNAYCFYNAGGTQSVQLMVTNNYGCSSSIQKTIEVQVPPPVSISPSAAICLGQTLQLSASGGESYLWQAKEVIENNASAFIEVKPKTNTEYSVQINTNFQNKNCELLLTTFVRVDQLSSNLVTISASNTSITVGQSSMLYYHGDIGANVSWSPATIPATGYTVEAFPIKPTFYTANATLGACSQTFGINIDAFTEGCEAKDFFLPNTFTPNNDGQNDVFYLRGNKVLKMHLLIYNRWGELIFESNEQSKGWDGSYKGKRLDPDVFGWYAEINCINGGNITKKGNISLLK